jgi:hypothetical protein
MCSQLIQKFIQSKGCLNFARLPLAKHNVNVVVQPLCHTPSTKNVAQLFGYLAPAFCQNSVNVVRLDDCVAPTPSQKYCKCGSGGWHCGTWTTM